MKKIALYILFLTTLSNCAQDQKYTYEQEIKAFQYDLNVQFSNRETSPLLAKDFKEFRSLNFFPINEKFRVVATLEKTPNAIPFEMQTSKDQGRMYATYAIATFTIDHKTYTLHIYESQPKGFDPTYQSHLFLPFNDLTNGNETYGAGRYIDVEKTSKNTLVIDFNKAYNPYCAFNHNYSCPIPPQENRLDIAIKAGETSYKK